ncbi:MAG: hypothetical protein K0S39_3422 [Paenibacillus sp.]|jgi:hypothetical protein|nr:hypothetical protein [Paenibacillus sp.]
MLEEMDILYLHGKLKKIEVHIILVMTLNLVR